MKMNSESEYPEWINRIVPVIEVLADWYPKLSQEHQIWFWIGSVTGVLLLIGGFGYLIYRIFHGLNNLLQTGDGWRPINTKTWMWLGSGIWLLLVAHEMRTEEHPGWSVSAGCGALLICGYFWFMVRRLKFLRATGASVANACIGSILAPIVIQSVILLLLLIVVCIALWISALFNPGRVVYVVYR